MTTQDIFYPLKENVKRRAPQNSSMDPLASFLNGVCLRHYYAACKGRLRISDPHDFARFRCVDLLRLGMSAVEVNRLVGHLLDLHFPVGHLLSDSPTRDAMSSSTEQQRLRQRQFSDETSLRSRHADKNPYQLRRPKLLRKLFSRHQMFHSSAPVSPEHTYAPLGPTVSPSNRSRRRHPFRPIRPRSAHRFDSPVLDPFHTQRVSPHERTRACSDTEQDSTTRPPLTCLISEKDIKLFSCLGVGSFGVVRRADWTMPSGEVIPVAVKLLRPEAVAGDHFSAFLDELRAMQCLSHPNLIRLHGVVLSNPIMMVTELAPFGNLLLHLRAQSVCARTTTTDTSPSISTVPTALQVDALWDMGVQIARGMAYLTSQGLVHRDLAARNILLVAARCKAYPQVKIADFGLVRTVSTQQRTSETIPTHQSDCVGESYGSTLKGQAVYMGGVGQRIAFAWSAPESLRNRVFSQATDVWSWAVTCWEIWTNGAAPWPDFDAGQLLAALNAGRRLAWPRTVCPRRLYQIMLACWRAVPTSRPSFAYLAKRLDEIRPFEVVATQTFDEADRLGLEQGDVVVVLEGRVASFWWFGQNKRTGELGSFPRGIVKREGNLSPTDISWPCRGRVSLPSSTPSSAFPTRLPSVGNEMRSNITRDRHGQKHSPTPTKLDKAYTSHGGSSNRRQSLAPRLLPDDFSQLYSSEACYTPGLSSQDQQHWYPLQDTISLHTSDGQASQIDDAYSCFSCAGDVVSAAGFASTVMDDAENELVILDATEGATVGSCNATIQQGSLKAMNAKTQWTDVTDVLNTFHVLPPPPGPTDDEKDLDLHESKSTTPIQTTTGYPIQANVLIDLLATGPSVTSTTTASKDSSSSPTTSVAASSSKGAAKTVADSVPPLIDMNSTPTPPGLNNLRFPIPTAPIYQPPIRPYFFPVYRPTPPTMPFTSGIPSTRPHPPTSYPQRNWFPFGSSHTRSPLQPTTGPSNRASWTNQRPLNASTPNLAFNSTATSSTSVHDPFDWDDLRRSVIGVCGSGGEATRRECSETVPVDRAVLVEGERLTGSAPSPANPFYQELVEHEKQQRNTSNESFDPSRVPFTPSMPSNPKKHSSACDPGSNPVVFHPREDDDDVCDQLAGEICCVRTQVPGSTVEEARQALTYLLNPFLPPIPHLTNPCIPSAPPYQPIGVTATPNIPTANSTPTPPWHRTVNTRIHLAVRLLLARRLHQLGLTDWDRTLQTMSAFHWSLSAAADWLLDQQRRGLF